MVHVQPLPPAGARSLSVPSPPSSSASSPLRLPALRHPSPGCISPPFRCNPFGPPPRRQADGIGASGLGGEGTGGQVLEPAGPCDSEVLRAARTDGVGTLRALFLASTTRRSSPRSPSPGRRLSSWVGAGSRRPSPLHSPPQPPTSSPARSYPGSAPLQRLSNGSQRRRLPVAWQPRPGWGRGTARRRTGAGDLPVPAGGRRSGSLLPVLEVWRVRREITVSQTPGTETLAGACQGAGPSLPICPGQDPGKRRCVGSAPGVLSPGWGGLALLFICSGSGRSFDHPIVQ